MQDLLEVCHSLSYASLLVDLSPISFCTPNLNSNAIGYERILSLQEQILAHLDYFLSIVEDNKAFCL